MGGWRQTWLLMALCIGITSAITNMGCTPTDRVDLLIEHLRSNYGYRKEKACKELGSLGAEAAKAIPALTTLLKTEQNDYIRRCVADALGKMGPTAAAAIPTLVGSLRDRNGGVRMAAAAALGQMKEKALPTLRQLALGKDGYMQLYAVRSLSHLGPKGIPLLHKASKTKYLQVQQAIAESVVTIARKNKKKAALSPKLRQTMVRILLKLMRTPNMKLQTYSVWSLSELGAPGAATSPLLTETLLISLRDLLVNASNQVKMYAAYTLRKLTEQATNTHPTLRKHIARSTSWFNTTQTLLNEQTNPTWYLRKHAISASTAFFAMLRQELAVAQKAPQEGANAAFIRKYNKRLNELRTSLTNALTDPVWDVRYQATRSLRELDGIDAARHFLPLANHPKPTLREHIIQTLGWIGAKVSVAKPQRPSLDKRIAHVLATALTDRSPLVRKAARKALVKASSPEAVQATWKRWKATKQPHQRTQWLDIITKIYTHTKTSPHKQTITKTLQPLYATHTTDPALRQAIARLLDATTPAKRTLSTKQWKDKDPTIAAKAIETAGILGHSFTVDELSTILGRWRTWTAPWQKAMTLQAIASTSKTMPPEASVILLSAIRDANPQLQRVAAQAAAKWAPHIKLIDTLLYAAKSTSPTLYKPALQALATPLPLNQEMGKQHLSINTKRVLPTLIKLSQTGPLARRKAAIDALSGYGIAYLHITLPILKTHLEAGPNPLRAHTARALGWLLPTMLVHGWKGRFIRASLVKQPTPITFAKLKRQTAQLTHSQTQQMDAQLQRTFGLKPYDETPVKGIIQAMQKQLNSPYALLRRNALFAIGNLGTYAPQATKDMLRKHLFQFAKKTRRKEDKHNLCLLFGRWMSHHHNAKIVRLLKQMRTSLKGKKTAQTACTEAINQLQSEDKPFVLWVNHPRSPTLESYEPAYFRPHQL
jgi:HEAT repeat protein